MSPPIRFPLHGRTRGSGLLEVLISMSILALAAVGAVMGMVAATRDVKDGQVLQGRRMLLEARVQRLWLASKSDLLLQAVDRPGTFAPEIPFGTAPWKLDPSPASATDVGTGAYFRVKPTGEVEPMTGVPANTPCLDSTPDSVLPRDVYCREILVTKGLPRDLPLASQALVPAGALPFTVWTRVFRKGDSLERAVVHSEVFVQ
ncbi:type II secretion system protein [Corallococcus praedator]|uniref:Type II secretion system protein n=1 Tax=Corallococcus praedator TaxID=2316724 RepID=A0ABX9QGX6_9BACT|nr:MULTISPECIES: type II secretion system protein [Corallococcus]RKH12429.1 type II secretion system protein [Corallococcus sp. CA047B]RKH30977.1 type II secretion system protein [Corallococcus sp. CA031C]RKI06993.1 type II secretion system protein [Corallococcus praedator]